ncbi:MAG TPA: transporter, partial [Nitrospirales bacterium]|nr:transporter [Nitrospirales bacterium]
APLYVHAERETDFGGFRDQQTSDGVGDLALALRYQAWYERGARPSVIFDVDWKSRTGGNSLRGTGAYSVGYGVTLLKSLDPVVFFARGGYVYNIARDNYDLGNIFEYRLGMGFSLNDRVSFNIQLAGALVGSSQITATATSTPGLPGAVFVGSRRIEIMNLYFTTTVVVTKNFFIEPVVGIAMTDTAFTTIGIRMPFRMFSK